MTENQLTTEPRTHPLRAILIAMLLAFAGGLALMGWAFMHWPPKQNTLPSADAPLVTHAPETSAPAIAAPLAPTVDAHMAALDARLNEIDKHAAASADQAARAEGLLIAFAARRALDRGVALGYLEGELNSHFGTAQPLAVANIIAASQSPITLDQLRAGLDGVMPEADPASAKADWWARVRGTFSGLITIRKAGQSSTAPDERMIRARLALSTGAVENALAEVARLPGGVATNTWMASARRYIAAHSALDVLEAAALMRPSIAKAN